MDFSKFSHDDFEVKSWVNGALEAYKDNQSSLDVHASSLVMKLQLFIQEVNQGLEEASCSMLTSLPRALRDMEAVRQEATLLRQQMQVVKDDIKKVEHDTASSMRSLVELDAIKTRMQGSLEALQEADNWTTLAADVQTVFDSQDIQKIAEKLAGMEQSLHVLHDVPDFEERHKFLESLKDKFEAILSPRLVAAIDTHATEEASLYVRMCVGIGRANQLRNYYIACHKGLILQQWRQIHSSSDLLFPTLSAFYDELLDKWRNEFSWCGRVGLEPLQVLPLLFSQSLNSLSPSLSQCLQEAVRASATPLTDLQQLRQVCFKFLSGLDRAVSGGGVAEGEALLEMVECVHSPYCQLLVRYPTMETQLLKQQLHTINMSVVGGLEEGVASMCDSVPWVFQYASEAVQRCFQLTKGWGYHGLIKALQAFFSQYVSTISSNVHQLRRGCGLNVKGDAGQVVRTGAGEEWSVLQHVFQLLQLCGDILLRTRSLCEELHSSLVQAGTEMHNPASHHAPFSTYDYLAVYHQEERTASMVLLGNLQEAGSEDRDWVLPDSLWTQLQTLNEQVHTFAFDVIFNPLKQKLERVPHLQVWSGVTSPVDSPRALSSEGLPQFSLSPLPYITEIGDYLLTLPRQLEPFTSQDSPALRHALRQGKLPFSDSLEEGHGMDGEEHPSNEWLGAVSRGTMETYSKQILLIPTLPPAAASQLTTDIAYLSNVLTALGQLPSQQLMQLETLLKPMDQAEFEKLKGTTSLHHSVNKLRTWQ